MQSVYSNAQASWSLHSWIFSWLYYSCNIMAEGFRFMPLGLVRWEPFGPVRGLLGCNINTGVHAHVRKADVSLRDVTIARDEKRGYRVQMTSRTRNARRILGIWRKFVEKTGEDGWFSLAHEALGRCRTRWGSRWKSQNRKIVLLSPYVEEPLSSKVILKKFRTWTKKSLRVFRISRFLCSIFMEIRCTFHT